MVAFPLADVNTMGAALAGTAHKPATNANPMTLENCLTVVHPYLATLRRLIRLSEHSMLAPWNGSEDGTKVVAKTVIVIKSRAYSL